MEVYKVNSVVEHIKAWADEAYTELDHYSRYVVDLWPRGKKHSIDLESIISSWQDDFTLNYTFERAWAEINEGMIEDYFAGIFTPKYTISTGDDFKNIVEDVLAAWVEDNCLRPNEQEIRDVLMHNELAYLFEYEWTLTESAYADIDGLCRFLTDYVFDHECIDFDELKAALIEAGYLAA